MASWAGPMGMVMVVLLLAADRDTTAAGPEGADGRSPVWHTLAPLPDAEGFAGMFAGTIGEALVVAGGANFPGRRPWEGGLKTWYDAVWMLDEPGGTWRSAGRLPRPAAYGVSASTPDGLICAGGGDARHHHADVYRLSRHDGRIGVTPLPSLPRPCAFASGAVAGQTLYLAGGIEHPDAVACLRTFWCSTSAIPVPAGERWSRVPVRSGCSRCRGRSATGSTFSVARGFIATGRDDPLAST